MPRGQKQFPTYQVEIRQIDCQAVFQFQAAPLWIGDSMRHFSIITYLVKQCVIPMSKICYICFIMRFWEYIVVAKILLLLECKHRGLREHHAMALEEKIHDYFITQRNLLKDMMSICYGFCFPSIDWLTYLIIRVETRAHNLCHDNRQLIVIAINRNRSASKNNCN